VDKKAASTEKRESNSSNSYNSWIKRYRPRITRINTNQDEEEISGQEKQRPQKSTKAIRQIR